MSILDKKLNIHLFSHNDNYYIFDINKYITLKVNKDFYNLLNSLNQNYNIDEDYYKQKLNVLNTLAEKDILFGDDLIFMHSVGKYDSAYLSFAPIYQCNFNCTYCFGNAGNVYPDIPNYFSHNEIVKMLDFFFYKAFPHAKHYRIDFVSSGEPLLNFDAIKATINYIEDFQKLKNKSVFLWLCTNGSLVTEEICQYLDQHNISMGISLDGTQDKHNKHRIDIYGKPTYAKVINAIEQIQNNVNLSERFRSLWGLSVITSENIDISEILKHHHDIGLKSVQLKFVRSKDNLEKFYNDLKLKYTEFSEMLLNHFIEGNIDYLMMILNDNDYFGKLIKRILLKKAYNYRCRAGRNKITICPNGDIYPCDSFVGIKNKCIGNIYSENRISNNEFHVSNIENRESCKSCSVRYLCGGDCYYNTYIKTGSIKETDRLFCNIIKHLCNLAIWLCCEMEIANKSLYLKIAQQMNMMEQFSQI